MGHHVSMHKLDQEKAAFMIDKDLYCYSVMPFGLKNAGATYQRLVNKMFKQQIGWNMKVYVDNMLVKSIRATIHITDFLEAFDSLRHYEMKVNPFRCVFGMSLGKFLGFIIFRRGIKANPKKIKVVLEMQAPLNKNQLQLLLTGRVTELN